MGREFDSEKEFSENVDRLLEGQEVKPAENADKDFQTALDFAHKMVELRNAPSPIFKAELEEKLRRELEEQQAKRNCFRGLVASRPAWGIVTAALVVIIALVAVLRGFGIPGAQAPQTSAPAALSGPAAAPVPAPGPVLPPAPVITIPPPTTMAVPRPTPAPTPAPAPILTPAPPPGLIYSTPTETININVGEAFTIGLYVVLRLGPRWQTSYYDQDVLTPLIQDLYIDDDKTNPGLGGTQYFRFSAVKTGTTRIEFSLKLDTTGPVTQQKTFSISVR